MYYQLLRSTWFPYRSQCRSHSSQSKKPLSIIQVRDTNLETRAARRRLAARHKPYWRLIDQGRHLGYFKGKRGGSWIARYFLGAGRYAERKLGTADDTQDADGVATLDFRQAQEEAREWFSEQARKAAGIVGPDGPYTVADAIEDYLSDYQGRGGKAVDDARIRVDALILPTLGTIELEKLSPERIKEWRKGLVDAPPRLRIGPITGMLRLIPAATCGRCNPS